MGREEKQESRQEGWLHDARQNPAGARLQDEESRAQSATEHAIGPEEEEEEIRFYRDRSIRSDKRRRRLCSTLRKQRRAREAESRPEEPKVLSGCKKRIARAGEQGAVG